MYGWYPFQKMGNAEGLEKTPLSVPGKSGMDLPGKSSRDLRPRKRTARIFDGGATILKE